MTIGLSSQTYEYLLHNTTFKKHLSMIPSFFLKGVKLPGPMEPPVILNGATNTNNTVRPSGRETKCLAERAEAEALIQSKVPTLVQIFVPDCDENGKYKKVQHHEGTGTYWCVDPDTGDIINGSRTENIAPSCSAGMMIL